MAELFASGLVFDLILAGMALEAIGLALFHRATGRGVRPARLLPNLLSGMCLLLAMRVGIGGAWWGWVSLSLLGALAFHLMDLGRAWHSVRIDQGRRNAPQSGS